MQPAKKLRVTAVVFHTCLALALIAATAGRAQAEEILEEWSDTAVGASGKEVSGWVLANGDGASIKLVEEDGAKVLRIGPETFAHLRTVQSLAFDSKLTLESRLKISPDKVKAGVGFGVRSEELGLPVGYEVRINPNLGKVFLFRVAGEQEHQLLAKPLASGQEGAATYALELERSGDQMSFTLLADGTEVGSGADAKPADLGARVRPYLTSRGGTEVGFQKLRLAVP